MGLDKHKPILLRKDFSIDPFYAQNAQLASQSKSSLPNVETDVAIDKGQSSYYSVERVLKKLLENDKFIDTYLQRSRTQLGYVTQIRIANAVNCYGVGEETDLNGIYKKFFDQHINDFHGDGNKTLSSVAIDFLKADMSNFDINGAKHSFQSYEDAYGKQLNPDQYVCPTATSALQVSNDIVVKVEFSEDVKRPTNFINVMVCNKQTNGQFVQAVELNADAMVQFPSLTSTTYIYKEWLSGIKELYIHIPTTFTLYNENKNASASDYYEHEDVARNMTIVKVTINARHFMLNNIYQVHVCGQSLPLQIHNYGSEKLFSDVVLPSMLKTLCVQPTSNSTNVNCIYDDTYQTYTLYFMCYGTDEQAVKIFGD